MVITSLLNPCHATLRGQRHNRLLLVEQEEKRSLALSMMMAVQLPNRAPDHDGYPEVEGVVPLKDVIRPEPADPLVFAPRLHSGNRKSEDSKLHLSNGLQAKKIAQSGDHVEFPSGRHSVDTFHMQPNGGAIFNKGDGGWIYVSNARSSEDGGIGALEFDIEGDLMGYTRQSMPGALSRGGGKTPWNSFISCETWGCRQIDPYNQRDSEPTSLALDEDLHSVAYYLKGASFEFYTSQNRENGVISRFTPSSLGQQCFQSDDKWCALRAGKLTFLRLNDDGSFDWLDRPVIDPLQIQNATYMKVVDDALYVVSKPTNRVYVLSLDSQVYTYTSSAEDLPPLVGQDMLFFPGGPMIQGRDKEANYFTLVFTDAFGMDETVSVVISRDAKHLYAAYELSGAVYDITRVDGGIFDGPYVDINFQTLTGLF